MRKLKGIMINGEWLGEGVVINGLFRALCNISPVIIQEFAKAINETPNVVKPIAISGFEFTDSDGICIRFENKKVLGQADLVFSVEDNQVILKSKTISVSPIQPAQNPEPSNTYEAQTSCEVFAPQKQVPPSQVTENHSQNIQNQAGNLDVQSDLSELAAPKTLNQAAKQVSSKQLESSKLVEETGQMQQETSEPEALRFNKGESLNNEFTSETPSQADFSRAQNLEQNYLPQEQFTSPYPNMQYPNQSYVGGAYMGMPYPNLAYQNMAYPQPQMNMPYPQPQMVQPNYYEQQFAYQQMNPAPLEQPQYKVEAKEAQVSSNIANAQVIEDPSLLDTEAKVDGIPEKVEVLPEIFSNDSVEEVEKIDEFISHNDVSKSADDFIPDEFDFELNKKEDEFNFDEDSILNESLGDLYNNSDYEDDENSVDEEALANLADFYIEEEPKVEDEDFESLSNIEKLAMSSPDDVMIQAVLAEMNALKEEIDILKAEPKKITAEEFFGNNDGAPSVKDEDTDFRILSSNDRINAAILDEDSFIAGEKVYRWGETLYLQD